MLTRQLLRLHVHLTIGHFKCPYHSGLFQPEHAANRLRRHALQQEAFVTGHRSGANRDRPFRQAKGARKKGTQRLVRCALDRGGRDADPQRIAMETGELCAGGLGLEMDGQDCTVGAVLNRGQGLLSRTPPEPARRCSAACPYHPSEAGSRRLHRRGPAAHLAGSAHPHR